VEVRVAEDRLKAMIRVSGAAGAGPADESAARELIRVTLASHEVTHGLNDGVIAAAARRLVALRAPTQPSKEVPKGLGARLLRFLGGAPEASPAPQLLPVDEWVEVAAGAAPVRGRDGRVDLAFNTELAAGAEREDGGVDLRDRGYARNVSPGDLVATLVAAEPGTPGRDVSGRELAAAPGAPATLEAGANVERTGDRFLSKIAGYARLDGACVHVDPVLKILGSLGPETGSVDAVADVVVSGDVVEGFELKARGSIEVGGKVQKGARVVAGGDVTVRGGIIAGEDEFRVLAGRTLRAAFVEASKVSAGGDAMIGQYVASSHVRAGGWIKVAKGSEVRGSTLEARKGIIASTVGSEGETENTLVAGYAATVRSFLVQARKTIKELAAQRDGIADQFRAQWPTSQPDNPQWKTDRDELGRRQEVIDERLGRLKAEVSRQGKEDWPDTAGAVILVLGELRPKCHIDILGHRKEIRYEAERRVLTYVDPKTNKLATQPLPERDLPPELLERLGVR
jgi:hypothetical protein